VHLSSDGSAKLFRSGFTRSLLLGALLVALFLLVVAGLVGWRFYEGHLPTPLVPSVWVNINKADAGDATMFRWVVTGHQVAGIYTDDDSTGAGCSVEPFAGKIVGHSISLTGTFLNGSGTVFWSGTVSAHELVLDDEAYTPGSPTSFANALIAMKYPSCGPGSS
jgi:hypothetical protein